MYRPTTVVIIRVRKQGTSPPNWRESGTQFSLPPMEPFQVSSWITLLPHVVHIYSQDVRPLPSDSGAMGKKFHALYILTVITLLQDPIPALVI